MKVGMWAGDWKAAVDLGMCGSSFSGRVRMWLFGGTPSNALFYSACGKFEGWRLEGTCGEWLEVMESCTGPNLLDWLLRLG